MSIATLGAIAIDALPEAVGVILFYRIGEFFEEKATDRSRTEIMNAVDMRPQEVRVVDTGCGGEIVVMAPEKVEVGWTIEVRPGDLIPLDGTVLEGETRVNTAPVTGEPVPVRAVPGTQLMSGCINESGRITMRVDKVLEESMVTKILDMPFTCNKGWDDSNHQGKSYNNWCVHTSKTRNEAVDFRFRRCCIFNGIKDFCNHRFFKNLINAHRNATRFVDTTRHELCTRYSANRYRLTSFNSVRWYSSRR